MCTDPFCPCSSTQGLPWVVCSSRLWDCLDTAGTCCRDSWSPLPQSPEVRAVSWALSTAPSSPETLDSTADCLKSARRLQSEPYFMRCQAPVSLFLLRCVFNRILTGSVCTCLLTASSCTALCPCSSRNPLQPLTRDPWCLGFVWNL